MHEDDIFWDVALCILEEVYPRLRGICCIHHQGAVMQAAITFESSVNFYQATRSNIPLDIFRLVAVRI
jgi:hypothetical protein